MKFFILDVDEQPEIVQVAVPDEKVEEFKEKVGKFKEVDYRWMNDGNPFEITEDQHLNFYRGIKIKYADFDKRFGSPSPVVHPRDR